MSGAHLAGRVAKTAWKTFNALPRKCKPIEINGQTQWVPCSALVVASNADQDLECVALATGAKCLPESKVAGSQGRVIHDCHAEILTLRTFNAVLLQECSKLVKTPGYDSRLVQRRTAETAQPFELKPGLKLYMCNSEAPCGDASMELIMAEQDDASPWIESSDTGLLNGRGFFSQLGVVRRKPARGDSAVTLSKSCSDKLSLKQCTSLLSNLTGVLIHPGRAYLDALVLPHSQMNPRSIKRAFSAEGRMEPMVGRSWPGGYAFHPFDVLSTDDEFAYSRRTVTGGVSHISAIAWPDGCECIIHGILQGKTGSDPRKASLVSREKMWQATKGVLEGLAEPELASLLQAGRYSEVKAAAMLAERRHVKAETISAALPGWVSNAMDDFLI